MSTAAAYGRPLKMMYPTSCSCVKGDTAEADIGNVTLAVDLTDHRLSSCIMMECYRHKLMSTFLLYCMMCRFSTGFFIIRSILCFCAKLSQLKVSFLAIITKLGTDGKGCFHNEKVQGRYHRRNGYGRTEILSAARQAPLV